MKKYFLAIFSLILLGCSGDDNNNNCNLLIDVGVSFSINLNLPQFSPLQFTGSTVKIDGQGNGGLILVRVNSSSIRAWDGADPNHAFSSCSILDVEGLTATCGCEDANAYELFSGQITGNNPQPCTLKEYRVEAISSTQFLVSN